MGQEKGMEYKDNQNYRQNNLNEDKNLIALN